MTLSPRTRLLSLLILVAPAACAQQPADAPQAAQPALAAKSATPAPQIVTGLPDFTQLVEQVGPGVVNIEVSGSGRSAARGQAPDAGQLPEIFRRMLPPGFEFPEQQESPQPRGRVPMGMGSGFVISDDGYILTNHHVIAGADQIKVKFSDRREFEAKVIGSDEQYDVALLKIDAKGLPHLRLGDSAQLKPGQWAVAIGSPLGLEQSVTAGIVSAVGRSNPYSGQQYVPFIQTDVAINRGNSGGPLLNTRGEVVGINSQIFSNTGGYMGVSFAIPIDLAMNAVEQFKTSGRVQRGLLGVNIQAITADYARGLGLPDTRGALVSGLQDGGAAQKAGIEIQDVIVSVNGQRINTSADLPPLVGAMAPGTRVKIGLIRDGKPREVTAVLTALEGDATAAAPAASGNSAPQAAVGTNSLGIVAESLGADARRQLGLKAGEGVLVGRINGNGAREAGLSPGDVILQVGRTPVDSPAALNQQLKGVKPGQTVMLLVRARQGGTGFLAVTADEN